MKNSTCNVLVSAYGLAGKFACAAAFVAAVACAPLSSSAQASTISCTSCGGTGGPYPITWSVVVGTGITLDAAYYLYDGSTPVDGPSNQNQSTVLAQVKLITGLSSATDVDEGDLSSGNNAGTDSADIYALHFGGGAHSDYNDLILVFSGATTLTDVTLQGLSNFRSFDITTTPLPAALPLFAGGLGFVGYLTGRKKRKAGQALAAA